MRYRLRTLLIVLAIGPPVLAQEVSDPGEALYGTWEIVEMVHLRTVQDFGGNSGGCFEFLKDGFNYFPGVAPTGRVLQRRVRKNAQDTCKIRPGEMDMQSKYEKDPSVIKAKYELVDGKLRVAWRDDYGDRPESFDEAYKDRRVTLFVLKKVK